MKTFQFILLAGLSLFVTNTMAADVASLCPPDKNVPCQSHMSKTVGVSVHSMEGWQRYCTPHCVLGGTVALDAILNKNQRVNGKAGWKCGSCPAMLMEESEEESVAVNAQSARSGFMCSIVMVSGLAVLSYFF